MMLALVGINANAAMYIVGTNPFGGWNPAVGMEMTLLEDGTYTLDATLVEADIWFIFTEQIGSWDLVNANRYDSGMSTDMTVTAGVEFTPVKGNTNKSFAFSGTVGQKYTFTFNPTTMKAKVSGYVEPITEFTYTVAGNNTTVFGTEWDVTNTDNDMTLDETDGLYKLVKNNVEITAGTLYYKVVRNHSWGKSWGNPEGPDGNQDYVFNENGTYNLTFKFDLENEIVSLDAEKVQDGPAIDPYTGNLYIVGQVNGNAWDPSNGIAMTNVGDDDTFTLTNAQITDSGDGYGYFSFLSVLGESATLWPANGYRIGAAEDGTLAVIGDNAMGGFNTTGAFKIEPGYYNFNVVLSGGENGLLTITAGEAPEPQADTYTVAGTPNLFGSFWSANDSTNDMTLNAETGLYTWTKSNVVFEDVDTIEFKVVKNHDWEVASWPENNWWYRVAEAGTYDFVITFDPNADDMNKITFTATKQGGEEPETVYTVAGPEAVFGSNWNEADTTNDMTLDAETGLYTWTKSNVELTTAGFGFKVVADHSWDNSWPNEAFANYDVAVEEAGIYTIVITFNAETKEINCVITKTGDIEPVHYDGNVYIMGEVNDNGGWFTNKGVLMTRDAEKNLYTATITTAGENVPEGEEVGYSYFSFTKQLVDSAADWEGIAPYRFGAVSDGDFWVTDEVLGTEIALQNNGQSFRVPAGKWNLTLSVDNMTLVIEKVTGLRGDVNDDKDVSIADVTALIDYLLSGDATGVNIANANCNLDEGVTIGDVTALIDYLLSGVWAE